MNKHSSNTGGLTAIVRRFDEHGVVLPADLDRRLQHHVNPYQVEQITNGTASELVGAWLATRSAPRNEDVVWVILLQLFWNRFSGHVPGLKEELRNQRMSVLRTRIEIALQLGSRCFHLGRRLISENAEEPPGRFLLQEGVKVLTWVSETERRLPDTKRRQYQGQLANSLIILARRAPADDATVNMLRTAETHSQIAEGLGDHTEEHFAYRIEAALRLFNATRDDEYLERAHRFTPPSQETKRLLAVLADLLLERGHIRLAGDERQAEGIALLHEAEARYGETLALGEGDGVDDGYLLAKRGLLRNWLYRHGTGSDGRRDGRMLDAALQDLLDPRAVAHTNATLVANALLDRARIHAGRNQLAAAREDRRRAREFLTTTSTSRAMGKLVAADFANAVREAIDTDDISRLGDLAEEMASFPADEVIPSAMLALACKTIATVSADDSWRPLVGKALDRIEADLAHPAVTAAATRHIAGHAALLAWLLARSTDDMDMHRRALVLYQTSFTSISQQPSADAQANAGTIALALGKSLLAGDESDAENAADLFVNAIGWFHTALTRANYGPTNIREDFDRKIVHSRLGEAALRVYPLLWTPHHLDLAIEHLGASRELGQDAPQLIGLLGDAYYRRGTRNGNPADLEQAIVFKDEAFAAGGTARENRSVTAAAALRLFGLTNEPEPVSTAARRALQAAVCDQQWPWPVLQLGEIAVWSDLLDSDVVAAEPRDLAHYVVQGQRDELLRYAAALAVHTIEFQMTVLGGQQRPGQRGVRVINDPHRLIEHSLVLKRLARNEAHKEGEATKNLRKWLASRSAPSNWLVPEPLDVVDLPDGDSVYVMRRSHARILGSSVIAWRSGHGSDPRPRFREAIRFLAAFQAWRAETEPGFPRTCGPSERDAFSVQLEKAHRKMGLKSDIRELLAKTCAPCRANGMPVVAKKDPHPGNWLWTRNDEIVLIDIESTVALPILQEVVTILDDLPLLELSGQGLSERRALCDDYFETLHQFGFSLTPLDREAAWNNYEALLALHAVKGLGRLRRADPEVSSFSLSTQTMQETHYRDILQYLRSSTENPTIRTLAEMCSEKSAPG